MTQEEIRELFIQGIDCSQVVTGRFADRMGMEEDDAKKMSSCFGGGMMCGETCGAVTGALMVIGMTFGHSRKGDQEQKQTFRNISTRLTRGDHKRKCRKYDDITFPHLPVFIQNGKQFRHEQGRKLDRHRVIRI